MDVYVHYETEGDIHKCQWMILLQILIYVSSVYSEILQIDI